MSRPSNLSAVPETTLPPREHCAYCEAPLPPLEQITSGAAEGLRFCCYGCRVLHDAGQRPLETAAEPVTSWFKVAVGAVLAGQSMLLGLAINLTPAEGLARMLLHAALMLSSLAALVVLGKPLVQSALEEVRQRRISIEILFLAGIAGALGASLYSSLAGAGAVYYEVVAVLVTVYSVGKTLGAHSRARALAETRHLQRTFGKCQRVAADGSVDSILVTEVRAGDQVRVLAGEPIPVDGVVTQGQAFVCETPLTGEPFPVVRRAGDAVYAGSYSEDGELRITASVPGTERRFDRLVAALEDARERPSRLQAQADRVVSWFLPFVLVASLGTWVYWTWHSGWSAGVFNALAVLLVACPCAMGLATPVALWSGLAALAARGLVVRGGDTLERLASLNRIVFDKTGTLSEEEFSLVDLVTTGTAQDRVNVAAQLAAVQAASSHPVARAFRRIPSPSVSLSGSTGRSANSYTTRSIKAVPALGVEAWLAAESGAEHHLRVGQRELMSELAAESELLARLRRMPSDHLVYVESDGRLQAIGAVRERLRSSTREAMSALASQGIDCRVMTGDRMERAAELLGPDGLEGGLTPDRKADRVAGLEQAGVRVGFVGDGVNDAPAMRSASLGIAMAHGAGVTTTGADAVLYGGDLKVLPYAVAVARQVKASIRSNLLFAATYNLVGIALAATGLLHPVVSALLMVVSSFTVSWRALRSTEAADSCCLPSAKAAATETARWERLPDETQSRWTQRTLGFLLAAQAPFLVYLGKLPLATSAWVCAVFLILGILTARYQARHPEVDRFARMTFAMLSLGNWGMILGWWADAGFGPVSMGCPGCDARDFHLTASFAAMPWMNLGMVLLGVPPMLLDRDAGRGGLSRLALGLLSTAGMIVGMAFGGFVFLRWLGSFVPSRFLLSFCGMTVGMLLGMFLCCELGRALTLAWRRR